MCNNKYFLTANGSKLVYIYTFKAIGYQTWFSPLPLLPPNLVLFPFAFSL